MPYGITQCYLPPCRGDIPAFTPAKAGTRFSDPRGMQGWVDPGGWLEMVYPLNGHPSWTNQAQCWLTSLMRPTTLTTTPSCHPCASCYHVLLLLSLCVLACCQAGVQFPDAGRDRGDVFVPGCGGGGWRTVAAVGRGAGAAYRHWIWSLSHASYWQCQSDTRYSMPVL